MDSDTTNIKIMCNALTAVENNIDMATAFHEVWKPTTYDEKLLARMSVSYATQAFLVIKAALRREMLLALMRIWDTTKSAHSLNIIIPKLRDQETWKALIIKRSDQTRHTSIAQQIVSQMNKNKDLVLELYSTYADHGTKEDIFKQLIKLRHGNLAHTQAIEAKGPEIDPMDEHIDTFYKDTAILVSKLLSLINGEAKNPDDTRNVYAHYAKLFWVGVRGENTEGHPDFKQKLNAPLNTTSLLIQSSFD